jgi:hypothetical protein
MDLGYPPSPPPLEVDAHTVIVLEHLTAVFAACRPAPAPWSTSGRTRRTVFAIGDSWLGPRSVLDCRLRVHAMEAVWIFHPAEAAVEAGDWGGRKMRDGEGDRKEEWETAWGVLEPRGYHHGREAMLRLLAGRVVDAYLTGRGRLSWASRCCGARGTWRRILHTPDAYT